MLSKQLVVGLGRVDGVPGKSEGIARGGDGTPALVRATSSG
ncbi:hypothetical protein [Streptomyces sp. NK08204]|nr:hypothetical protein [Streptomyces sp. NK08204]